MCTYLAYIFRAMQGIVAHQEQLDIRFGLLHQHQYTLITLIVFWRYRMLPLLALYKQV